MTGGADEVAKIKSTVEALAKFGGTDTDTLTQSALINIADNGDFLSGAEPEPQMMFVLHYLLSQPSTHPDHPGLPGDYVPMWDLTFDVHVNSETKTIDVDFVASLSAGGQA